MNARTASRLAWSLWTGVFLLFALLIAMLHRLSELTAAGLAVFLLVVSSFATVGALIASRRPSNPIGWVFSAIGILMVVASLVGGYAQYGLGTGSGPLPLARAAVWIGNWIWPVAIFPIGLPLLLFPDGRPPSRRWAMIGWTLCGAIVLWVAASAFMPGGMSNAGYPDVVNPIGIDALADVLPVVAGTSLVLGMVSVLACAASLIARYRRATSERRQQLKWLAYSAALIAATAIISLTVEGIAGDDDSALIEALQLSLVASLSSLPLAAGIAILRYRLYDIDRIINRTLVYGALTALLAAIYVGLVMGLPNLLDERLRDSELLVAGATLLVAALFSPLQRRVQGFIDRRFYRGRYDAERTAEAFAARLRDEVQLSEISTDLLNVVQETLQPTRSSLWLREFHR